MRHHLHAIVVVVETVFSSRSTSLSLNKMPQTERVPVLPEWKKCATTGLRLKITRLRNWSKFLKRDNCACPDSRRIARINQSKLPPPHKLQQEQENLELCNWHTRIWIYRQAVGVKDHKLWTSTIATAVKWVVRWKTLFACAAFNRWQGCMLTGRSTTICLRYSSNLSKD